MRPHAPRPRPGSGVEWSVCGCGPPCNRQALSRARVPASTPRPGQGRCTGGAADGPTQAVGLSHSHQLGCVPGPVSGSLCASGSARPHLVALTFAKEQHTRLQLCILPPVFPFRRSFHLRQASTASPRSPRPAHARAQLASRVGSSAIGPGGRDPSVKSFLSGSASYAVVRRILLFGSRGLRDNLGAGW